MKRLLPILGLVMLAACNQSQTASDASQAAAEPAAPAGPHSNAAPGTYLQTNADGSQVSRFLATDGTYTNWVAGEMVESGTWAIENDKTCFHPKGKDKRCSSDGPVGPDGSYTVTPDEGQPYTVKKTA